MNIYFLVYEKIISVLKKADMLSSDVNLESITVDMPTEDGCGEITTNAAMILAKFLKKSPRDIAVKIKELLLEEDTLFKSIEIAGPGFINFTLKAKYWHEELSNIIKLKNNYGKSDIGKNKKLNLEFASPNPTGPMHIGHARGAIYGDVLATLLTYVGYDVTKEYYVNDYGNQMNVLVDSIFFRYRELLGEKVGSLPDGCYPGEYVIDAAAVLKDNHHDALLEMEEEERKEVIKSFAIDFMMQLIKHDLDLLGVKHDLFFYESTLHKENKVEEVVELFKTKDLVYTGVLEKPKGYSSDDWDSREQLLFRSTKYGDDIDRSLKKKDDSWTYFAADLAYLRNKLERGFAELIMVLGADHVGFIKRMKALCASLNDDDDSILDIKICQMVTFLKDNKPLKMSKRAGTFIGVKDVLEMVSKDIIRFMMLIRKNTQTIDFDVEKVVEQSKDNPVFYVQYANARASSILRSVKELDKNIINNLSKADLSLLDSEKEILLLRMLSYWPKTVERAAITHDPHRIIVFLQNVAVQFHSLWSHAKEDAHFKFVHEDNLPLTKARAVLAYATSIVISSGLGIIGVEPVNKM